MKTAADPLTLLRTDPVVLATVAGALTAIALRAAPAAAERRFVLDIGTDLFIVLMTVAALLAGLAALPGRDERTFWRTIAGGFGAWALVLTLYLTAPDPWWTTGFHLVSDSLYLVFYLFLLVAVDGRPDLRFERRVFAIGGRYRVQGTVIHCIRLYLHSILVPVLL